MRLTHAHRNNRSLPDSSSPLNILFDRSFSSHSERTSAGERGEKQRLTFARVALVCAHQTLRQEHSFIRERESETLHASLTMTEAFVPIRLESSRVELS